MRLSVSKTLSLVVITATLLTATLSPAGQSLRQLDYEGFSLWLDCERHRAVRFRYNAQHDTGSFKRASSFYKDPAVPAACQQTSTGSYKTPGERYDRGHLVPANHLDFSENAIRQSNYMTNILPQAANMNRGAWLATEEIVECYRDMDELLVMGGVLWEAGKTGHQFTASHGVETPSAFWKVIIRGDGRAQGWLIPNSKDATRKQLDKYLVRISQLETIAGEKFPVNAYTRDELPTASWQIPRGCNKG